MNSSELAVTQQKEKELMKLAQAIEEKLAVKQDQQKRSLLTWLFSYLLGLYLYVVGMGILKELTTDKFQFNKRQFKKYFRSLDLPKLLLKPIVMPLYIVSASVFHAAVGSVEGSFKLIRDAFQKEVYVSETLSDGRQVKRTETVRSIPLGLFRLTLIGISIALLVFGFDSLYDSVIAANEVVKGALHTYEIIITTHPLLVRNVLGAAIMGLGMMIFLYSVMDHGKQSIDDLYFDEERYGVPTRKVIDLFNRVWIKAHSYRNPQIAAEMQKPIQNDPLYYFREAIRGNKTSSLKTFIFFGTLFSLLAYVSGNYAAITDWSITPSWYSVTHLVLFPVIVVNIMRLLIDNLLPWFFGLRIVPIDPQIMDLSPGGGLDDDQKVMLLNPSRSQLLGTSWEIYYSLFQAYTGLELDYDEQELERRLSQAKDAFAWAEVYRGILEETIREELGLRPDEPVQVPAADPNKNLYAVQVQVGSEIHVAALETAIGAALRTLLKLEDRANFNYIRVADGAPRRKTGIYGDAMEMGVLGASTSIAYPHMNKILKGGMRAAPFFKTDFKTYRNDIKLTAEGGAKYTEIPDLSLEQLRKIVTDRHELTKEPLEIRNPKELEAGKAASVLYTNAQLVAMVDEIERLRKAADGRAEARAEAVMDLSGMSKDQIKALADQKEKAFKDILQRDIQARVNRFLNAAKEANEGVEYSDRLIETARQTPIPYYLIADPDNRWPPLRTADFNRYLLDYKWQFDWRNPLAWLARIFGRRAPPNLPHFQKLLDQTRELRRQGRRYHPRGNAMLHVAVAAANPDRGIVDAFLAINDTHKTGENATENTARHQLLPGQDMEAWILNRWGFFGKGLIYGYHYILSVLYKAKIFIDNMSHDTEEQPWTKPLFARKVIQNEGGIQNTIAFHPKQVRWALGEWKNFYKRVAWFRKMVNTLWRHSYKFEKEKNYRFMFSKAGADAYAKRHGFVKTDGSHDYKIAIDNKLADPSLQPEDGEKAALSGNWLIFSSLVGPVIGLYFTIWALLEFFAAAWPGGVEMGRPDLAVLSVVSTLGVLIATAKYFDVVRLAISGIGYLIRAILTMGTPDSKDYLRIAKGEFIHSIAQAIRGTIELFISTLSLLKYMNMDILIQKTGFVLFLALSSVWIPQALKEYFFQKPTLFQYVFVWWPAMVFFAMLEAFIVMNCPIGGTAYLAFKLAIYTIFASLSNSNLVDYWKGRRLYYGWTGWFWKFFAFGKAPQGWNPDEKPPSILSSFKNSEGYDEDYQYGWEMDFKNIASLIGKITYSFPFTRVVMGLLIFGPFAFYVIPHGYASILTSGFYALNVILGLGLLLLPTVFRILEWIEYGIVNNRGIARIGLHGVKGLFLAGVLTALMWPTIKVDAPISSSWREYGRSAVSTAFLSFEESVSRGWVGRLISPRTWFPGKPELTEEQKTKQKKYQFLFGNEGEELQKRRSSQTRSELRTEALEPAFIERVKDSKRLTLVVTGGSKIGKSSQAKMLAIRIGDVHFPTGSIFRAAAHIAVEEKIALDQPDSGERLEQALREKLKWKIGANEVVFYYRDKKLNAELESLPVIELQPSIDAVLPMNYRRELTQAIKNTVSPKIRQKTRIFKSI